MSTSNEPDVARRYAAKSWATRLRNHPAGPVFVVTSVLLAGCILAGLLFGGDFNFLSSPNTSLVLRAIPNFGLIALGVGLLMIAGEFDLSVGSVYVVAPFAMIFAYVVGVPWLLAIALAFAIAILVGLMNGVITLHFGVPSFITTLGTMFIVRAAAPFIVGYKRSLVFKAPPGWKEVMTGKTFEVPNQFWFFLLFSLLAYLLLSRHKIGNHFIAVGGDARAARFAGINVIRTKLLAFVTCSVFATIAGIFQIMRSGKAETNPQLFIELYAVAICVIGGVSLFGGRGTIIGIMLGAAMLQLVQDAIILARLPGFYLDMFVGMMIVVGVVLNQAIKKRY